MKHWIKRSLFGLLGAAVVLGSLSACGHHGGPGWQMSAEDSGKMRSKMVERASDKLELTAEQKLLLTALADKLQAQRAAMMAGGNPRAEVQALVAGDKFDRTRAQALVTEKTAALNTGSPEVIAAAADFYDNLNPVQQQKVRAFMKRRGGWPRG